MTVMKNPDFFTTLDFFYQIYQYQDPLRKVICSAEEKNTTWYSNDLIPCNGDIPSRPLYHNPNI
jgi:hypothetical protein